MRRIATLADAHAASRFLGDGYTANRENAHPASFFGVNSGTDGSLRRSEPVPSGAEDHSTRLRLDPTECAEIYGNPSRANSDVGAPEWYRRASSSGSKS